MADLTNKSIAIVVQDLPEELHYGSTKFWTHFLHQDLPSLPRHNPISVVLYSQGIKRLLQVPSPLINKLTNLGLKKKESGAKRK